MEKLNLNLQKHLIDKNIVKMLTYHKKSEFLIFFFEIIIVNSLIFKTFLIKYHKTNKLLFFS